MPNDNQLMGLAGNVSKAIPVNSLLCLLTQSFPLTTKLLRSITTFYHKQFIILILIFSDDHWKLITCMGSRCTNALVRSNGKSNPSTCQATLRTGIGGDYGRHCFSQIVLFWDNLSCQILTQPPGISDKLINYTTLGPLLKAHYQIYSSLNITCGMTS